MNNPARNAYDIGNWQIRETPATYASTNIESIPRTLNTGYPQPTTVTATRLTPGAGERLLQAPNLLNFTAPLSQQYSPQSGKPSTDHFVDDFIKNLQLSTALDFSSKYAPVQPPLQTQTSFPASRTSPDFLARLDEGMRDAMLNKQREFKYMREDRKMKETALLKEIETSVLVEKCKRLMEKNYEYEEVVERLLDELALKKEDCARQSKEIERLRGVVRDLTGDSEASAKPQPKERLAGPLDADREEEYQRQLQVLRTNESRYANELRDYQEEVMRLKTELRMAKSTPPAPQVPPEAPLNVPPEEFLQTEHFTIEASKQSFKAQPAHARTSFAPPPADQHVAEGFYLHHRVAGDMTSVVPKQDREVNFSLNVTPSILPTKREANKIINKGMAGKVDHSQFGPAQLPQAGNRHLYV